jgi:hypothetical protein
MLAFFASILFQVSENGRSKKKLKKPYPSYPKNCPEHF